jgi:hypothetical protein
VRFGSCRFRSSEFDTWEAGKKMPKLFRMLPKPLKMSFLKLAARLNSALPISFS